MNSDCLKTTPILLGKAASIITPVIISLNHVSRFTVLRNLRFGHCTSSTKNELRERQTQWTNKSRRLCSVARCTDSFTADNVILYFTRQQKAQNKRSFFLFSFCCIFNCLRLRLSPQQAKTNFSERKNDKPKGGHTMQMKQKRELLL